MDFILLLIARRGQNKSMSNIKTRFEAQVSHCNAHNPVSIQDTLLALMLLVNSNIHDNQYVSMLAAAVSNVNPDINAEPFVVEMLGFIKYASIKPFLRQGAQKMTTVPKVIGNTMIANQAHSFSGRSGRNRSKFRQHRTPEDIPEL